MFARMVVECVAVIYAASFLFGAPLYSSLAKTLTFSVLQTLFLLPVILKEDKSILHMHDYTKESKVYTYGLLTVLLGSCIVVPLDWNRPWQRWPLPQTIGSCLYVLCAYPARKLMPNKIFTK